MSALPANSYELEELAKVIGRRARERYLFNAATHAQAELTANILVTLERVSADRLGMLGFVREVAALALFIREEVFDTDGNLVLDFPRIDDKLEFQTNEIKLRGSDPLLFPDLKET